MKLPKIITQDLYYYKPTEEIVKEPELVKFKETKEKDFITQAEVNRKIALDNDLEKKLYNNIIEDFMKKYLDNSYIINKVHTKEEKLDEKLDDKDNTDVTLYIPEYSKDKLEDIKPLFQEFCRQGNKVLRALKKTRKNDYLEFYQMLKENYGKKEEPNEELDELEETIMSLSDDSEEKKLNKLEILLQNTYDDLERKITNLVKPKVNQYISEYNEVYKNENKERMTKYLKSYKSAHIKDFRYDLDKDLINIFDDVINFKRKAINFLDDGKKVALITQFDMMNKQLKLTSGQKFSERTRNIISFNLSNEDYLVTYGDTFTYVCKDNIII